MQRIIFFFLFLPNIVLAQDKQSIQQSNFEAGANFNSYNSINTGSVNIKNNLPLKDYLAASIDASIHHTEGKDSSVYSSNGYLFTGNIFLREATIGKIDTSYTYAQHFTSGPFPSSRGYTNNIAADYYLDRATFGVTRFISRSEGNSVAFYSTAILLAWYADDNLKLGLSRFSSDFQNDKFSTTMTAEYQPSSLNNSASIGLSYSGDPNDNSFNAGIFLTYFFDTRVNLFERDRKYR
jgi:hypothetical protein